MSPTKTRKSIAPKNILYELMLYTEWTQESDIAKSLYKVSEENVSFIYKLSRPWTYFKKCDSLLDEITNFQGSLLSWNFTIGEVGSVLAILQDSILEVRTPRDDFSSVVGKTTVAREGSPQWRRLCWSPDCTVLAIASCNGGVNFYDLFGSNLFNIPPTKNVKDSQVWMPEHSLAGMFFIPARAKKEKWPYELILVDYAGELRSYHVSTDSFTEYHHFSFSKGGVSSVCWDNVHNLLYVCTPPEHGNLDLKTEPVGWGLSAWRLLNDHPYYRRVVPSPEDLGRIESRKGLMSWFSSFYKYHPFSVVFKMAICPESQLLACLHTCGSISVWHLPSLRLRGVWSLREQPGYDVQPDDDSTRSSQPQNFLPVDISWWPQQKVMIARRNGAVSVCDLEELRNMLGEKPEFVCGEPRLSPSTSQKGVLVLECETGNGQDANEVEEEEQSMFSTVLYWLTDMERFQPRRRRARSQQKIYRLRGIKSTTPEELFSRKIDAREFEEALHLAEVYGLDCDRVYQSQWHNSPVTEETITAYLSKISKRGWVFEECRERVPDTLSAARKLTEFGLRITSLSSLAELSDNDTFTDDTQLMMKELMSLPAEELTDDQKSLILTRRTLLKFSDRLFTYEKIINSSEVDYDREAYDRFRRQPVAQSALEYARRSDHHAVALLLTHHGPETQPYWLSILSNFPETTDPGSYKDLLPECSVNGEVYQWEEKEIRGRDWSENEHFAFLERVEDSLLAPDGPMTPGVVEEWFRNRVYELELMSNMVDQPLQLVRLARERNIKGLDSLYNELVTLDVLIYDVGMENITLRDLEIMTPLQQAQALMSQSNEDNFVEHMRHRLLPYLQRCEKLRPNSRRNLLSQFLAQISIGDLSRPLQMFAHCIAEPHSGLVESTEELISMALDSVYGYTGTDQLAKADTILKILPVNSLGLSEAGLSERVQAAREELKVAQILKGRGHPMSLSSVRALRQDVDTAKSLLVRLTSAVGTKVPVAEEADWNQLLQDLLQMQKLVLTCIPLQMCYEVHVAGLLASDSLSVVRSAVRSMCCHREEQGRKPLPLERSVALVLQAATHHFDSAETLTDHQISLARGCLNIITDDNAEIQEEKDLIAGLQLLNEFKISILPVQVRLCKERMQLIESCLTSRPTSYKDYHKLLSLAHKLRICGNDSRLREGTILLRVANIAFQAKDYRQCAEVCQQLMDRRHAVGWEACARLGQCADYEDISTRQTLTAFALIHCPDENLRELIETRCELEHKRLQIFIHNQTSKTETPEEEEEEYTDAASSPQVPSKEFLPLGLSSTLQTTSKLLSQFTNTGFWRDKLLNRGDGSAREADSRTRGDMSKQGFPDLYASLHADCHESSLYTEPDAEEWRELRLVQTVLRASLLEQEKLPKHLLRDMDDVLTQLAALVMPEDSCVGLATLLAVGKPEACDQCFSRLPHTLLTLQLAVYLYALREAAPHHPDVFLWTPDQVLAWASSHTDSLSETSQLLTKALTQLNNFEHSKHVEQLNCGVDIRRFAWDPQYKTDSILGLAMCEEWDKLQVALDLGAAHGVEAWEVVLNHFRALLTSNSPTLTERLSDNRLTSLLREHSDTVVNRFQEVVLPTLSGVNYSQLISYYTVLQTVAPDSSVHGMVPRDHVKLIKKVKATSTDIDYVRLVTRPQDVMEVLRPCVRQETINILAKLLKELLKALPSLQQHTSVGQLYQECAVTAYKAQCLSTTCRNPLDQFSTLLPYLQKLSGTELLNFIRRTVFCHQSVLRLDPLTRQDMIDAALRCGQTHGLNGDPDYKTIHALKDYIQQVWDMEKPSCKTLKNYLVRLDEACGDTEAVGTVIQTALVDASLPSSVLQEMARLTNKRTLSSYVTDLLNSLPTNPAFITTVLQRVEECLAAGEKGDSWSILIGPLTERPELPASVRKQASLLTQRLGATYSEELEALRLKTEALLRRPVALSQVSDQNSRYLLFKQALSQSNSWDDLHTLHLLLLSWPHVDTSWSLELVEAMADSESPISEMYNTLKKIFKKNEFEEEEVTHLVARLERAQVVVTVCLLTEFPRLHDHAVLILRSVTNGIDLPEDLVRRIVEVEVVARLHNSPIFSKLMESLRELDTEVQQHAANQLRTLRLTAEADSLLTT
ncbi:NBAS subunit of NRZ tethering complex-like isoform X1 [Macrosteles quadrilineatus]|uniref:NBAS subunit of NRZ tethering complex-like isoform X1 n=1 Tax=Macrosteles quadrilineatus TaxID=74068 RepID=UPI0023E2E257|nr:NBAS subunit of NRZ tethering complex-like isoform X1 [Macrosteles quadrilineatus]